MEEAFDWQSGLHCWLCDYWLITLLRVAAKRFLSRLTSVFLSHQKLHAVMETLYEMATKVSEEQLFGDWLNDLKYPP